MFLYLSKALPLLVYPLGLALILITVALVVRRWRRFSSLLLIFAAGLLLFFSNGSIAGQLARSLEWQYLPDDNVPSADAIVLLGGATRAGVYPRRMTEMNEAGDRIIEAARLYRLGKAPLIMASGGAIDWLGSSTPEADGMQELLEFVGVPSSAIVVDRLARNTYENAVNIRALADERGVNRILLVTSALHMPRSIAIFESQGFEVIPAPTDFEITVSDSGGAMASISAILYQLLPDVQYLELSTRALKEYLGAFVYQLRDWM